MGLQDFHCVMCIAPKWLKLEQVPRGTSTHPYRSLTPFFMTDYDLTLGGVIRFFILSFIIVIQVNFKSGIS